MVSCDICGKEFKNTQGLRGHKNFVHGDRISYTRKPATQQLLSTTTEQLSSKLEQVASKVEQLETKVEQTTSIAERAIELAEVFQLRGDQVPDHTHQHQHSHGKYSYDSEHRELLEQVDQRLDKQLDERLSKLKNEFVNKTDQIEIRLRKLEPVTCSPSKRPLGTCTGIRR